MDYNVGETNIRTEEQVSFSFKMTNRLSYFLLSMWPLLISLFLIYVDLKTADNVPLGVHIVFAFPWITGLIIYVTCLLTNYDASVLIDPKKETIEYNKKGKIIKFTTSEIAKCEYHTANGILLTLDYIYIKLNDNRRVIITPFIAESTEILSLLNLKCKIVFRIIPFLPIK